MTFTLKRLPALAVAGVVFVVALALFTAVNRPSTSAPSAARVIPLPTHVEGADAYAALGDALIQRLRETGDAGLYGRAERAFEEALQRDPRNLDATIGLGTLALARHDFRAGLRHGLRARRLNPRAFAPFAVLVDARIELGRYGAAERTLQQMIDFKPTLASYARVSYYRELHGDIQGALDAMRLAVSAAPGPGENRSYVQTLLGNLEFERGQIAAAAAAYRAALAGFPAYAPAEVGLARVYAARGRLAPAIERLRGVVDRLPLPAYVIALGETQLASGRRAAAKKSFELVRAQQRLLAPSGANTDAEISVFEADHGDPVRAVRLARHAYAAAPSVRSADALGWALTRAGRPREGFAYSRRALRLGSRDPLFLYHAGIAARAAGEPASARRYLAKSVRRNPRFSPLYAPRALRALRSLR
jgi:tetratricopeptide (TPR) repeat protein